MKIIIAILVFSVIVIFHELGHFILAKKNGIAVTEFSLGMGPRLWSTQRGETRYSLKLFPIGGSCMMVMPAKGPLTRLLSGRGFRWWRQVLSLTSSWRFFLP